MPQANEDASWSRFRLLVWSGSALSLAFDVASMRDLQQIIRRRDAIDDDGEIVSQCLGLRLFDHRQYIRKPRRQRSEESRPARM